RPHRLPGRPEGDAAWLLNSHTATPRRMRQSPTSCTKSGPATPTRSHGQRPSSTCSRTTRATTRTSPTSSAPSPRSWPHDSHRHPIRGHPRRRRRRLYATPRPTHPRTPLHHTKRTRIQEPTMTESPLTPDAIEVAIRDCMPKVALDRLSGTQVMRLAEDMHAALTEPPPRPEGA